ncbi:MAG: DUF2490 domain-containing protein [Saonia sp.]
MTTSSINRLSFLLFLIGFSTVAGQENFVGFWQPEIAINYKVNPNYSHNFSIAQRNFIYENEDVTLKTRQLDLVHFSRLKIRDNQSIGAGILYRFRNVFEEEENELRFTQQFNGTYKPRNIRFGHRLRTEQRITPLRTTHRFRYRFAIDFPLQGEKLDVGECYFIGTTESLLSVSKSNTPQYDQRFVLNLGWLLNTNMKLQTGLEYRFEDYAQETENVFFILSSLILTL